VVDAVGMCSAAAVGANNVGGVVAPNIFALIWSQMSLQFLTAVLMVILSLTMSFCY
jgi:hypothetical protein